MSWTGHYKDNSGNIINMDLDKMGIMEIKRNRRHYWRLYIWQLKMYHPLLRLKRKLSASPIKSEEK